MLRVKCVALSHMRWMDGWMPKKGEGHSKILECLSSMCKAQFDPQYCRESRGEERKTEGAGREKETE